MKKRNKLFKVTIIVQKEFTRVISAPSGISAAKRVKKEIFSKPIKISSKNMTDIEIESE